MTNLWRQLVPCRPSPWLRTHASLQHHRSHEFRPSPPGKSDCKPATLSPEIPVLIKKSRRRFIRGGSDTRRLLRLGRRNGIECGLHGVRTGLRWSCQMPRGIFTIPADPFLHQLGIGSLAPDPLGALRDGVHGNHPRQRIGRRGKLFLQEAEFGQRRGLAGRLGTAEDCEQEQQRTGWQEQVSAYGKRGWVKLGPARRRSFSRKPVASS